MTDHTKELAEKICRLLIDVEQIKFSQALHEEIAQAAHDKQQFIDRVAIVCFGKLGHPVSPRHAYDLAIKLWEERERRILESDPDFQVKEGTE